MFRGKYEITGQFQDGKGIYEYRIWRTRGRWQREFSPIAGIEDIDSGEPEFALDVPTCGWGCQCSVVTLSERDLRRMGKDGPDVPPAVGGVIDVVDPRTGKGSVAKVEAKPGWDYVPGESNVQERRQQLLGRLDSGLQRRILGKVNISTRQASNLSGTNQGQIRVRNVMSRGATPPPGIIKSSRFESRHLPQGRDAQKLLRQGKSVHIFLDEDTMNRVESDLLTRGQFVATVRGHDRYGLSYQEPIGYRITSDGERQPLYYAELKVKDGEYHAVPRNKPAT